MLTLDACLIIGKRGATRQIIIGKRGATRQKRDSVKPDAATLLALSQDCTHAERELEVQRSKAIHTAYFSPPPPPPSPVLLSALHSSSCRIPEQRAIPGFRSHPKFSAFAQSWDCRSHAGVVNSGAAILGL